MDTKKTWEKCFSPCLSLISGSRIAPS